MNGVNVVSMIFILVFILVVSMVILEVYSIYRFLKLQRNQEDSLHKINSIGNTFQDLNNTIGDAVSAKKNESTVEMNRYYLVCYCILPDDSHVIRCFTTDDLIQGELSRQDLKILQENVLVANKEYKACEIIFFSKIKV